MQFAVADEVKIGDQVVLPSESSVRGTVVEAMPKRRMGRAGKLDFSIDSILAPDGGKIPVRYSVIKKEGGSHTVRTGVITAGVAVVFWPAAPFVLLMHGKDTTFIKGMTYEVFTDAKYVVKPKSETKAEGGVSAGNATLNITSTVPGAEISIDGAFVGNTPSSLRVGPGDHDIKVSSAARTWQRQINVQAGGSISLAATFEDAAPAAPIPTAAAKQ